MKLSPDAQDLLDAFTAAVNAIPGAQLTQEHVGPYDEGFDGVALFTLGDKPPRYFAIDVARNLFPRDLPQIVWSIKKNRTNHMGSNNLLVLIADTISTGARDWMQTEGVGYYDSSGSLFLPTPDAYILIDRPTTKKQDKVMGSVFTGRRPQVIEALWDAGRAWTSVKSIAEQIDAAPSLVSSTLQELERHEWVEVQGSGPAKERRLSNWEALLDAWTDSELRRKGHFFRATYYVPQARPPEIVSALDAACEESGLDYEVTGELAGNAYAPLLTSVSLARVRMPSGRARYQALDLIRAKPVAEGWNLAVIDASANANLLFRQRLNDMWVASPVRTYLDLLNAGGRGKDAALMLREQRLRLL